MSDIMTSAASPLPLDIAGREFSFKQLRGRDLAEFEAWVNKEKLGCALEFASNPQERLQIMREVAGSATAADVYEKMMTFSGVCRLLWMAGRDLAEDAEGRKMPRDKFLQFLEEHLTDVSLDELMIFCDQLQNGGEPPRGGEDDGEGEENPTPAQRSDTP